MQGHLQEDELEKQLGLFKDEKGIIRCRGRLGNSQASYDTKFPAILSRHNNNNNNFINLLKKAFLF